MTRLPEHPFHVAQLELGLTRCEPRVSSSARGPCADCSAAPTAAPTSPTAWTFAPAPQPWCCRPGVVVCDRSAAWLWGVDCFGYAEHELLPRLEVVSTDGQDRSRRGELLGGKRDLRDDEICEVHGVRVTTPLRTACDLACLRGRKEAQAFLDAFRREHGLTCADYARMLSRFAGRRGVKQARELAPSAVDDAESQAESWTRRMVIDAGFPAPETQVWVLVPGFGRVRLDLAYEWPPRSRSSTTGEEHHTDAGRPGARRDAGEPRSARPGGSSSSSARPTSTGARPTRWLGELRAAMAERVPAYQRRYSRGESWGPRAG